MTIDAEEFVNEAVTTLDPLDPRRSAEMLIWNTYTQGDHRLLHHYRGSFWQFAANHYDLASNEAIRAAVWDFLDKAKRSKRRKITDEAGNVTYEVEILRFKPNMGSVSNVVDALAGYCFLDNKIEPPAWLHATNLPPAAEMLPVANGLLHLPTGTIYEATPGFFGLNASDVVFDPNAPEPKHWLKFLDDIFGPDTEAIETLQDFFGYFLSTDTSQQKILLTVGPKRSGKGTIARVATALIDRANVAAPTLAGLQTNFGLAPLIGKPLGIISDARLGGRADQAAIAERLLSISGEDTLTIDRKHSSAWTGRLATRFMILTNELPRIVDSSGALASRFIVLILRNSFYGKEDPGLSDRLLTELSGILNWAIVGYRRLRERRHFIQPASAREAVDELETLGSPIAAFIRECCRVGPGCTVPVELIYQKYGMWCEDNGHKKPNKQTFGRNLRAAVPFLRTAQRRGDVKQARQYEGITVESRTT